MNKACKILLLVGGICAFASIMFIFLIMIIINITDGTTTKLFDVTISNETINQFLGMSILFSIPTGIVALSTKNRRNYAVMIINMCLALISLNAIVFAGAIIGLIVVARRDKEQNIAESASQGK